MNISNRAVILKSHKEYPHLSSILNRAYIKLADSAFNIKHVDDCVKLIETLKLL